MIDLERGRADLLPLWKFCRIARKSRRQVWFWWKYGLRDRRNPDKNVRIHLETILDGSERCTTWEAYKTFCRTRDIAKEE